jgi:two-component system nitrogen regulation response regulator GlnG
MLTAYDWPGNVRELQSVIRQSLLNASGPVIVPDFLPPEVLEAVAPAPASQSASPSPNEADDQAYNLKRFLDEALKNADGPENLHAETMEFVERYLLTRVLDQTGGNQSQAARILGITRGSLRNKIRTLGISIDHVVHLEDEDG